LRREIAVIGAGVAGAICARRLAEAGERVTVFDKGTAIGGRLAQRRGAGAVFDHGAQFVRPRDRALIGLLEAGIVAGTVARWPAAEVDDRRVYVGRPGMATPLEQLLAEVPVKIGCRVETLARTGDGWWLEAGSGGRHGPFETVVVAIPAPQALALLTAGGDAVQPALLAALARVTMAPCWALMLAFDPPLPLTGFDARPITGGPIAWLARNTTKPGRDGLDSWTVHASPDWSTEHLEAAPETIAPMLLAAFAAATGCGPAAPVHMTAHRWRHALVTTAVGEPALLDRSIGLGFCGDWCLGGKIEAAFRSGRALARLLGG
jgi:renalase